MTKAKLIKIVSERMNIDPKATKVIVDLVDRCTSLPIPISTDITRSTFPSFCGF